MKIFNDVIRSLNESKVHVRVLSTFDFVQANTKAEDIKYLLSPMQASQNETLPKEDANRFSNVNMSGVTIHMEDESRMKELRERGGILGADEYYEEAWLTVRELSYAVYRGEPVLYNDRNDIRTIHRMVHMFIDDYTEKHGSIKNENTPLYLKCLIEYLHHIDALYHTYFGQFKNAGMPGERGKDILSEILLGGLNAQN